MVLSRQLKSKVLSRRTNAKFNKVLIIPVLQCRDLRTMSKSDESLGTGKFREKVLWMQESEGHTFGDLM